ncbi:ABC transporter ATP-binding protein [Paralimibaculum aggregatum]|nr:ATP-binding cassette domain-containing protein [Limibaculum sp. NKW23]
MPAPPAGAPVLAVEGLTVAIQKVTILHGISLSIEAGEMVALIGHNGAGKTTFLRALMGIQPLAAGRIDFAGARISDQPLHRRAALRIGYMPEDRRLIPTLSVAENILLPGWTTGIADAAERLEGIYAMIPEIAKVASRPALSLSGGQQKLVALARALMIGDRLLLLDEPFEGVAPALVERFQEIVAGLRSEARTVLICDSSLDRERSLYSRWMTIERGAVVTGMDGREGQPAA